MQTAAQDKIRKQCIELGTRQVDCGQPYTEAGAASNPPGQRAGSMTAGPVTVRFYPGVE